MDDRFVQGAVVAAGILIIVGWLLQRLVWALSQIGNAFKPQTTSTKQTTSRTPFEVVMGCVQGVLMLLILAAVAGAALYYLYLRPSG